MPAISGSQRALKTARVNQARVGASRCGFAPRDVQGTSPGSSGGFYKWTRIYPPSTSWTRVFPVLLLALLLSACAHTAKVTTTAKVGRTSFELTTNRRMAFPGTPILLTARMVGGAESEEFYCPRIVWTWPNGTESSAEEGACQSEAFEARSEYPRAWTHWIGLAQSGAEYPVSVRWEKAGRVLGRASITLTALGGE